MFSYKQALLALIAVILCAAYPAHAEQRIAVIDIEALINESAAGKSLQEQLKKKREEFQKEFATHEAQLGEKEKALAASKADMSPEEQVKARQKFEADLLETRKLFQKRRAALDKGLGAAMQALRSEIVKATATVAEEKGYKAVFLRESVVIVEKELDITKLVLEKLNATVKSIPVTVN